MKKNESGSNPSQELNKRVEEFLVENSTDTQKTVPRVALDLIADLQMQNQELSRSYEELEESRNRYSYLYDFAPVGYFTLDENTMILELNLTGADLLGNERHHIVKSRFSRFVASDFVDVFYHHLKRCLDTRTRQTCEVKLEREDGDPFYAQLQSVAMPDGERNFNRLRMAVIDITEAKGIESELKFRTLFQNAPIGIGIATLDGNILAYNNAAMQITGYRGEEMEKINLREIYWDPKESLHLLERFNKEGVIRGDYVVKMKRKDRTPFYVNLTVSPFRLGGEKVLLTVFDDITGRRQNEEKLKETEKLLSSTLHALQDLVIVIDKDLRVVLSNWKDHEYIPEKDRQSHRHCYEIFMNRKVPCDDCHAREIFATGRVKEIEITNPVEGKSTSVRVLPIFDTEGNVVMVVEQLRNITELKQAEQALQSRTEELQIRLNELDCLIGISHLREKTEIMSLGEILQGVVDLVPTAYQYPENTCARIIMEDQAFKTENFRETIWKQTSDIFSHGKQIGTLEVFSLDEMSKNGEGYFIKEGGNLIKAIAERLGKIMEHFHTEAALRESEEKYRLLIENASEGVLVAQDGMIKFVNTKMTEITGYSEEEMLFKPFIDFLHPDEKEIFTEFNLDRLREGGVPGLYNLRIIDRRGNTRWLEGNWVLIDWEGRPATLNLMTDITERKHARERIKLLTHELLKAQENERQMISQELHDRVAQDLSALKIECDMLLKIPSLTDEAESTIAGISNRLKETIEMVRDLSYNLRPPALDQMGITEAIIQHCEDFSEKTGLKVDFHSSGMDHLILDSDTEINIYRIIQEALNNIWKHADATHVNIRLLGASPNIILRIEDNGRGFDVEQREATLNHEKRMGLRSMKERVRLLEGEMEIQSRSMKGTKIFIKVPYREYKE